MSHPRRTILVAGATGFVGRALVPALAQRGHRVRACSRHPGAGGAGVEPVRCDLLDAASLPTVLDGVDTAFYLVHSLGSPASYRSLDREAAQRFVEAAGDAGLRRIVYLGGVAPRGPASEHLASRLEVGRILRSGAVPAIELRAAMIVGPGSASWQIVRDLAMRLPAMVMPAWLSRRLSPIALDDVVVALLAALELPLDESVHYDVPGPEILTGKEILERIAAIDGRRIPSLSLPWLTPRLAALWLRIVTRADFALARELILGLTDDLLPESDRFWELTGLRPQFTFDEAARAAIAAERRDPKERGSLARLEESIVRRAGPRARATGV